VGPAAPQAAVVGGQGAAGVDTQGAVSTSALGLSAAGGGAGVSRGESKLACRCAGAPTPPATPPAMATGSQNRTDQILIRECAAPGSASKLGGMCIQSTGVLISALTSQQRSLQHLVCGAWDSTLTAQLTSWQLRH
jgi:hypothetical protein